MIGSRYRVVEFYAYHLRLPCWGVSGADNTDMANTYFTREDAEKKCAELNSKEEATND